MANSNTGPLSKEHIKSLPILKLKISGEIQRGHYDTVAKKIYLIDDNDELTGMYAEANLDVLLKRQEQAAMEKKASQTEEVPQSTEPAKIHAESPPNAVPPETKDPSAGGSISRNSTPVDLTQKAPKQSIPVVEPSMGNDSGSQNAPEVDKPRKSRKKPFIIIAVILAVILIIWIAGAAKIVNDRAGNTETAPPQTTTVPTQGNEETTVATDGMDETTGPTEGVTETTAGINVLSALNIMLPGHIISQSDFELVNVTETEYRALGAAGGVYTDENLASLEGLVIVNYVSSGKYLSYDDVGTTYNPLNPWAGAGDTIVSVPIQLSPSDFSAYLWGNTVTLELEVQSKYTASVGGGNGEETTYPPGIDHNSSTVESTIIDRYIIKDAVITDVLGVDSSSLFIRYKALSSIPIVFLHDALAVEYADGSAILNDIPHYINVGVSAEQGALLQQILNSDYQSMTIRVVSIRTNIDSEVQSTTYAAIQEVEKAIAEIWMANAQEE